MSLTMLRKLSAILDRGQKIKIAGLMILILIGGIMETASASLILPLVSAVLDEEKFSSNKYVIMAMNALNVHNIRTFTFILLGVIIAAFIVKNAFLIFQTYLLARFANRNRARCTTNLLWQFLHRPYEYYLYAETSDIIRTIYGDMDNIFNLLLQCMNFAAELIVSACLGIFLLVLDWKMTILVAGLLGILTLYNTKVIKKHLNNAGEGARITQAGMYKWILQSASGIKDVKVLKKEYYFTDKYSESAEGYADNQIRYNVLTNLPRLLIETTAIVGILTYVMLSMALGRDIASLMTTLSAFAIAAMRLLPSVNRLNTYMANIAYFEPALEYIYENVDTKGLSEENVLITHAGEASLEPLSMERDIRLNGITFAYPNTDKLIFNEADMQIPIGSSVGVMGPSGAGKSTIVDIMLGLLKLEHGTITVDDVSVSDHYAQWLSHIGYIPQNIYMLDDSIKHNIAFGVKDEDIDEARVWEVLGEAQMKEFVEGLPDKLDAEIGERGVRISGGQRQRLGIARALYHDPELMVFDEATSALDNDTETAIMEAIDRLHGRKTLVIIAHRLRTIENCDLIYEVKDGKIIRKDR
ncbi:MAG: ABC transporter ATP-binding protein/permease [Lachnospiraceae bacterium]|nr:ABC transporter ATP-binding protein/permease [Lachnospiraceae bacterium]